MIDAPSELPKNMKKAIITGITGQDGAYLAQLLLDKGYTVYGTYRRTSSVNFWRIEELGLQNHPQLQLLEYDLTDLGASIAMVQKVQPDEIYNLAAQSFVGVSFEQPSTTAQITGIGALNQQLQVVTIENVVAKHQGRRCTVEKRLADDEGLGKPVGTGLNRILKMDAPGAAITK